MVTGTTDNIFSNLDFCNETAKKELSCVLKIIFDGIITLADAERASGTNKSNISRARDGLQLLNAHAASTIIMKAYKIPCLNEVRSYIRHNSNLDKYFLKELLAYLN